MKEYKLVAWPELPSTYDKTAFRRMLSDMSHRYLTLSQLAQSTSMPQQEIRAFLDMLNEQGLLVVRDSVNHNHFLTLFERTKIWLRRMLRLSSN